MQTDRHGYIQTDRQIQIEIQTQTDRHRETDRLTEGQAKDTQSTF